MIEFRCSKCNQRLRAKDERAGRHCKCPACETRLLIPAAPPPPPRAEEFDPPEFQTPVPETTPASPEYTEPETVTTGPKQTSMAAKILIMSAILIGGSWPIYSQMKDTWDKYKHPQEYAQSHPTPTPAPEPPKPTKKERPTPAPKRQPATLAEALQEELGAESIRNLQSTSTHLILEWNIGDPMFFSNRSAAEMEIKQILRVVHKWDNHPKIFIAGYATFIDSYGRTEKMTGIRLDYERSELDKINWDNFDMVEEGVFKIASKTWFHPEFRK